MSVMEQKLSMEENAKQHVNDIFKIMIKALADRIDKI